MATLVDGAPDIVPVGAPDGLADIVVVGAVVDAGAGMSVDVAVVLAEGLDDAAVIVAALLGVASGNVRRISSGLGICAACARRINSISHAVAGFGAAFS